MKQPKKDYTKIISWILVLGFTYLIWSNIFSWIF